MKVVEGAVLHICGVELSNVGPPANLQLMGEYGRMVTEQDNPFGARIILACEGVDGQISSRILEEI